MSKDHFKWAAIGVTLILALLAFTAQWGVINANLKNMDKRLSDIEIELRCLHKIYVGAEKRLSYLEGLKDKEHYK